MKCLVVIHNRGSGQHVAGKQTWDFCPRMLGRDNLAQCVHCCVWQSLLEGGGCGQGAGGIGDEKRGQQPCAVIRLR